MKKKKDTLQNEEHNKQTPIIWCLIYKIVFKDWSKKIVLRNNKLNEKDKIKT